MKRKKKPTPPPRRKWHGLLDAVSTMKLRTFVTFGKRGNKLEYSRAKQWQQAMRRCGMRGQIDATNDKNEIRVWRIE